MSILAGAATRAINPKIGCYIEGEMYPRKAERIRDSLEVNAVFLSDGKTKMLIFSLDLLDITTEFSDKLRERLESRTGVPAGNIFIACTHTHNGPALFAALPWTEVDGGYLKALERNILEAGAEAVKSATPAKIAWGTKEAKVGYNRRLCWRDGSHTMYGNYSEPGFSGLEGPDDPEHGALFAADKEGRLIAILHSNNCHSICMDDSGTDLSISADFAGEARAILRSKLREDLPILYLQGASGDTCPFDQMHEKEMVGEKVAMRIGKLLAETDLDLLRNAKWQTAPVLAAASETLKLGVRLPSDDDVAKARKMAAKSKDDFENIDDYWWEVGVNYGVVELYEKYRGNPVENAPIGVARIGDLALAFNPCELYCQFGLDIKKRSPAKATMISELTNGGSGYCPTIYGIIGGGYSGQPLAWARLEQNAGYKIVDATSRLLWQLWE